MRDVEAATPLCCSDCRRMPVYIRHWSDSPRLVVSKVVVLRVVWVLVLGLVASLAMEVVVGLFDQSVVGIFSEEENQGEHGRTEQVMHRGRTEQV